MLAEAPLGDLRDQDRGDDVDQDRQGPDEVQGVDVVADDAEHPRVHVGQQRRLAVDDDLVELPVRGVQGARLGGEEPLVGVPERAGERRQVGDRGDGEEEQHHPRPRRPRGVPDPREP